MTTKAPKKTETVWKSDWKLGGLIDSRMGIEINRPGKTILIWSQTRRYLLSPVMKKELKKHLPEKQFDRLFKRNLDDMDWLGDTDEISSNEEMMEHISLGPHDQKIREYLKVYETYRGNGPTDEYRQRMAALVANGTTWLVKSNPRLVAVISFKKKLPAFYSMSYEKKKRKAAVCNKTWTVEPVIRGQITNLAETNEASLITHLCKAATSLLGRECSDMADILRPTIKERLAPYVDTKVYPFKMEWYPQFLRPMFTHESFIEGVAKIVGNRGKKTRHLVASLVSTLNHAPNNRRVINTLYLAYLSRRILSAEEIQKLLETDRSDGGSHGCHTKHAVRTRADIREIPTSHRAPWMISFRSVEYCLDTLSTLRQVQQANIEFDWKDVPKDGNAAHDYLASMLVKKRNEGMYKQVFEIPKKFSTIHEVVVDLGELQARFALPKNKGEVFEWGQQQSHCIASYANGHAEGKHVLLEVAIGDDKYHMMIAEGKIGQFYGKFNKPPPENVDQAVRKFLKQKKLIRTIK